MMFLFPKWKINEIFNYTKKKQISNNLYEIDLNQSCEHMLLWDTRCMKYSGENKGLNTTYSNYSCYTEI